MENTAQIIKTPHTPIGAINVKTGDGFARVFIGKQCGAFIASTLIKGSVWFETGATGIAALLSLAGRLEGLKQQ